MPAASDTTLAPTLSACACAWLALEGHEPALQRAFEPAVAALDAADLAYRRTIEATLPPHDAGAMLSGMESFRDRVRDVRERTRAALAELYHRCGSTYGAFDPLSTYIPPTTGLSHADGTRVATISDAARSEVASLRSQVNAAVAQRLSAPQIETLVAAKRRRAAAFEAALAEALERALAPQPSISGAERQKTLYRLAELADGWY